MRKNLIGVFVVILTILVFSISCSCTADSHTSKPQENSQKGYSITELVPSEIIIIEIEKRNENRNPTPFFKEGIAEINPKYIIKNATPITETFSGESSLGSRTASLLLFVELRR